MTTVGDDTQDIDLPEDETPEQVDHADGTSSLVLDEDAPKEADDGDFFENLAETLAQDVLDDLAAKYLKLIDDDIEARKDRDEMQAAGLKKAGIAGPAPGGAEFDGASKVTHPVLLESYVDFSASAIKELMPPNGPVKTKIEGQANDEKLERAERKVAFMNMQLTTKIPSYRAELERLLTQLPVGGSQYMKIYWDENSNLPDAEFIPIDDIVLPFEARNFFHVQRKFHRMKLSEWDYENRVNSGLYIDDELRKGYVGPEDETASARESHKIEGKRDDYTDNGERIIYEGCVFDQIEGDKLAPENKIPPYIITIDETTRKVLAVYRNWDESDKYCQELDYIVDFTFIPWRGVFGLSLLQCMGGLPDALTGSLRALMDTALINNMAGGIKLKGNPGGGSLSVAPTQITEVDAMGSDDIRKVFMSTPFNPPSPVLFQLLGFLENAAKGVVSTAEESIADTGANTPVGTTLALIEQGAKVFSSIHARLHDSQRRCLEIFHRLYANHLPGRVQFGTDPDDYVTPQDFEGPMDVHPVSDPNIFSETQRFAQIQFVIQTVIQMLPVYPALGNIINIKKLLARAFKMAKIADFQDFLPPDDDAEPLNPADENVNMVMGKPVKAYPGQNHEAHIQVLLDFSQNQLLGSSPVIAQKFLPAAMNHLQDHLLTWYGEMMKRAAAQGLGKPVQQVQWNNDYEASTAMAKASPLVDKASDLAFQKIPQLVAQGMQKLQALAPKPPVDPMVQVAQQDMQNKAQDAQAKRQQDAIEHQDDMKLKQGAQKIEGVKTLGNLIIDGQKNHLDAMGDIRQAQMDSDNSMQQAQLQSQTDLAQTLHNNIMGHHTAVAQSLIGAAAQANRPNPNGEPNE